MEKGYLELLDPSTEPETQEFLPAPRTGELEGKRLGLLINGKPNSDRVLEKVADLLAARYGLVRTLALRKPSSSRPVPTEQIERLRGEADFVLNGVGD
ncbi:MAG: hypothetical protein ACE5JJ_06445 [Nitrospinota bacterium]